MASIKIVRRKNKQRKDGTAPLALRISENYKTSYNFIGQYVLEKDWDKIKSKVKTSHPNSKKINNFLLKKLTQANDIYFDSKESITPKQIKHKLKGAGGNKSFFKVAADRVFNKYNLGTFSVAKSELSILYNIEEFITLSTIESKETAILAIKQRRKDRISNGRKGAFSFNDSVKHFQKTKSLRFQDINESFIDKYKSFCSIYLGQKTRTITNQLIFIRTLYNKAIKDGLVDAKFYPFGGEKERIRISSGHKIGLTTDELEKIENLKLEPNTSIWHTKNAWLLAFYFAGIRISDVVQLKWSDFKDNRLLYTMDKNEKPVSLKIPEKAVKILSHYKNDKAENNGFIFHFLKEIDASDKQDAFRKMRNATKLFNKYLKRIAAQCDIDKNLSNHIARHTFGNIAGDRIHPLMLQKLYRHSDLKTTLNYQANFIHKDADEALDSVVNFQTSLRE